MGDEWKNVLTGNTVGAEDEVEAVENGETGGGLKLRARKKRVVEEEGETGGDAGVEDGQVVLAGEQARSVYLDLHQGIKSSDETNGTEIPKVNQSLTDESMQNHETDCLSRHAKDFPVMESYQHHNDLKVKNQPTSAEECGRILTGKEAVHNHELVIQPDEAKSVVEVDLERILEEQDTHDLYCPNCHSCITKRVILRKRKRTASENISDAESEEIEPVQAYRIANASDIEPDIFRCLSCFSFFIPIGTGFKSFRVFGQWEENENIQSSQQMPSRNQNCLLSLFELMKHKNKGNGLGDGIASVVPPEVPPVHGVIPMPGDQTMVDARLTRQWDVLKAIVYGGLLESIASLGVISSAAGSDVATLNVIALGLANLVGGLLVMIQNLAELKNEQYKSINSEEADRYWELLGKRGYFWLHTTVALITFILVGTLPPVIYGFSFWKSDNKEYKLIVVAGASLLCIALLAIGKAHVQEGRKRYLKTLVYYLGLGVGASALSYAVGMLIKKLLEKLGLFEDSAVATTSFSSILEVTSRTSSWRSY